MSCLDELHQAVRLLVKRAEDDAHTGVTKSGTTCNASEICLFCGQAFGSRNKCFRHLRESGCGGNTRHETKQYVALYGYLGTRFHGSQFNTIEEEGCFPTVEGSLIAAVQAALLQKAGVQTVSIKICSRASRTDRGVHALANAVCLKVTTEVDTNCQSLGFIPCSDDEKGTRHDEVHADETAWLDSVRSSLPHEIGVLRWFNVKELEFNARFACQKREYWYYVPYEALLAAKQRTSGGGECGMRAARECKEVDGDEACWVWLQGLPDDCTPEAVASIVTEVIDRNSKESENAPALGCPPSADIQQIVMSGSPGSAKICLSNAMAALNLCSALDKASCVVDQKGNHRMILALPETIARRWRAAHVRLREVLKRMTGTRSFHNFSPGFPCASDPRSMRSVYRCRSGMSCGYRELRAGRAFAVLRITGRDFLYHQIRSMVGLAVTICRGAVPKEYLDYALGMECGVEVPLAPGGNLVLAECVFRGGLYPAPSGASTRAASISSSGCRGLPGPAIADVDGSLCNKIVREIAGDAARANFTSFIRHLDEEIAPRMRAAFEHNVKIGALILPQMAATVS